MKKLSLFVVLMTLISAAVLLAGCGSSTMKSASTTRNIPIEDDNLQHPTPSPSPSPAP